VLTRERQPARSAVPEQRLPHNWAISTRRSNANPDAAARRVVDRHVGVLMPSDLEGHALQAAPRAGGQAITALDVPFLATVAGVGPVTGRAPVRPGRL
jgi:hypothetical protein